MAKNTMQEEIIKSLDKVEKERNLKEIDNYQEPNDFNKINLNIDKVNFTSNLDKKLNKISKEIRKEKKIYTTLYLKTSVNNKLNKISNKLNINKSDVIELLLTDFENS